MAAFAQPFEHRKILTNDQTRRLYCRIYPLLGWKLEGERLLKGRVNRYELCFCRPAAKGACAERQRLQMQMDAQLHEVERMERKCRLRPALIAYGVGLLGALLALAGVFAVHYPIARTLLLTALFLLAFAYPLYANLVKKFSAQVQPFIDKRVAEIDTLCRRFTLAKSASEGESA